MIIKTTREKIIAAFIAWEKDVIENPDNYLTDEEQESMTPEEKGESGAIKFIEILGE